MIRSAFHHALILIMMLTAGIPAFGQEDQEEEKAWPRVMGGKTATVTMYEPRIDSWQDDDFEARAAVSVKEGDAALDRFASVDSTFDGQPPVDWIYAFNELAKPRLFCASTWKYTIKPIWGRQPAIRRIPRWWWAEEIEAGDSDIKRSRR